MTSRLKVARVLLFPVQLPLILPGQSLPPILFHALHSARIRLRNGDVVCVASKVVSTSEGRIEFLDRQHVYGRARALAKKFQIDPELTQIVVNETDEILGGVRGFLLTIKLGILSPNAGVDVKNSPPGTAMLWPRNPETSADILRRSLERMCRVKIGVLIVDSRLTPLRLGTTGLSIGLSGFEPVKDDRGKNDLFRRSVKVTQTNVADDLAASAHLLMAERDERVGLVLIRNAPILMKVHHSKEAKLDIRKCLVCSNLVR